MTSLPRIDGIYRQTRARIIYEYYARPVRFFSIFLALVVALGVFAYRQQIRAQLNPKPTIDQPSVKAKQGRLVSAEELLVGTSKAIPIDQPAVIDLPISLTTKPIVEIAYGADRTDYRQVTDNVGEHFKGDKGDISVEFADTKHDRLDLKPIDGKIRPGRYNVTIKDPNTKVVISQQEFYWGVLAINTNKSIFTPSESAYLQMAVLDDAGRTHCTADLSLIITTPDYKMTTFSTVDETIIRSDTCGPDNVTDNPDYTAHYAVGAPGDYQMTLNNLDTGATITDHFQVVATVPFVVERTGATRINPFKSDYAMRVSITANADFQGTVTEKIPASFQITDRGGASLATQDDWQRLSWSETLAKDQRVELTYRYQAPKISPRLYGLGPLAIGDQFQEARVWQIAADAACSSKAGTTSWNTAGNWTCANVPTTTDTVIITTNQAITLDINTASVISVVINGSSTLNLSSFTLLIGNTAAAGTALTNNGTFTASTGKVTIGGTTNVSLTTFSGSFTGSNTLNNLLFNCAEGTAARTYTGGAAIDVAGNVDMTPVGSGSARAFIYNLGGANTILGTLTETHGSLATATTSTTGTNWNLKTGKVVLSASSNILSIQTGSVWTLTGTSGNLLTNTSGTVNYGTTSTLEVTSGSGSPTLFSGTATTPHILKINAPSATVINAGLNITTDNNANNKLWVAAGVFNLEGRTLTIGTSGLWNVDASATLCIGGTTGSTTATCDSGTTQTATFTFPTATYTFDAASTIIWLNDADQTVDTTPAYGKLNFTPKLATASGTKTYTMEGAATIHGDWNIKPKASAASAVLQVSLAGTTTLDATGTTTIAPVSGANTPTANIKLHPAASDWNISSGFYDLESGGTLDGTSSSSTITASGVSGTLLTINSGTYTRGTTTFIVTSATGSPKILNTATTFHKLTINAAATVINDGAAITINNVAAATLYVQLGVFNAFNAITGPGSGNGTIQIDTTLCLGGTDNGTTATCDSGATATTARTLPTFQTYTISTNSTVIYLSDANSLTVDLQTFYNLSLTPKMTSSRTYAMGGATTINGNFNLKPKASSGSLAFATNLAGTTTVGATKTTTIQPDSTNSPTAKLDTNTSNALSTGFLDIEASGNMTAGSSAITMTGTTATLLTIGGSGTFTANTSTVSLTGNGSNTINTAGFTGSSALNNLITNITGVSKTLGADLTVNDTTTVTLGTLDTSNSGNYTLTTGKISIADSASAIFTARASTVNLSATSGILFTRGTAGVFTIGTSTVKVTSASGTPTLLSLATTFNGLTIDATGVIVGAGAVITMSGTDTSTDKLYIKNGALDDGGNTIVGSANGTMVMDSGGTLKIGNSAASTFPTNYTNGIITLNSGSTVVYQSSVNQTVSGVPTYSNLTITPVSCTPIYSLGAATTVNGDLTINGGSLVNVTFALTGPGAGSGTFTIAASAQFCLSTATASCTASGTTATTMPVFQTYSFNATSIVVYMGNVDMTISGTPAYGNLKFIPVLATAATTRTYTTGGALTINGNFDVIPTASNTTDTLLINPAGDITVAATKTTTIKPGVTNNPAATLDLRPVATDYNLSTGFLVLDSSGSGAGTLDATSAASTITLTGTTGTLFTIASAGTFTAGSSTVTLTGNGSNTINTAGLTGSNSLSNLTINITGVSKTLGADIAVTGTTTVTLGTLDTSNAGNYALTTGKISIADSASAILTARGSIVTLTATTGTLFTRGTNGVFTQGTSEVKVTGAGTTTLLSAATTFHKLTINNSSNTVSAGAAITMSNADANNKLDIQSGTLDDGGNQIVGTANGTMAMSSGTTLKLGNGSASIFPTNYTNGIISLNAASTIIYNATINQTISGVPTYGHLKLSAASGTPTKTAAANIVVIGNVTIDASNTMDMSNGNNYSLTIKGNYANSGTFTAQNGTVTFNAVTGSKTITSGGSSFYDLTFNGVSGGWTLQDAATVSDVLTITNGNLDAGAVTLTLSGTNGTPFVNSDTFTANASTVSYTGANGSGNTNVTTVIYYNLIINASDTFDLAGATTINNNLTITTGTLDAVSGQNRNLTIGGNYSNSGTFTARNDTVTFTATDTGNTLAGTLGGTSAFYDLIFSGTNGEWTPGAALTATDDLTVTAGSLLGTNNVTVNGGDATGDGVVTLTSGTFVIKGIGNLGGNTDWTFNNLTIGNNSGTTTTTATGTGAINLGNTLTLDGGIASAATLNCGSKTWNLTGNVASPLGTGAGAIGQTFTAQTSTFNYTGNNGSGNTNVRGYTYYNLIFNNGSETYVLDQNVAANNDVTITAGTLDANNSFNRNLTVKGNYTNNGTFTARLATVTFNAVTTGHTLNGTMTGTSAFYNLTFNGVSGAWSFGANNATATHTFTITNGTVTAPSTTLTVGLNFAQNGTFTHNSGTVLLNGSAQQTVSGTLTGASSFSALTITNATGADASDCERTTFTPSVIFSASATTAATYTITTASVRIQYLSGGTYTFNNINWNGQASGTRIYFRNSATSGTWLMNVTAVGNAQTAVSYVNVSRSDASSGAQIIASDGTNTDCGTNTNWMFDETLTLSLDSTSVNFGTLSPGGGPYDATSTLTCSTNANNGYVVYTWASRVLTDDRSSSTIGNFTGSNASPATFNHDANNSYFGYSTDDTSLTASSGGGAADRFSGPKFAGFRQTGPDSTTYDPVADRAAPATSAQNIITYRVDPTSGQTAGDYTTTIIYIIAAQFP